jgi:ADP-heptose:LPS heptosyltransferase
MKFKDRQMKWDDKWKRIVFVPMDRIGDAISDTPALSFLHGMGIDTMVLCTPYTKEIFENNPHVSGVVKYLRYKKDGFIKSFISNQRAKNELLSFKPDAILGMMRPIRELRRIYSGLSLTVINKEQDSDPPIYLRWVNLFNSLGLDSKPAANEIYPGMKDAQVVEQWLSEKNINRENPLIVVHPGCAVYKDELVVGRSLKYWDKENYLKIFSKLPQNAQIILTGIHPSEIEENNSLKRASPLRTEVFDIKNIRALACLISGAKCLLTLDTGTLHVGAATKTPIVAIFGPTSPEKYGPLRNNITFIKAEPEPECRPCNLNPVCEGDNVCMSRISYIKVIEAIKEVVR